MLNKIRRELAFFEEHADRLGHRIEFSEAIVEMLTALIDFLVEAVKLTKKGDVGE